ncbi:MAG: CDP-glucose 4,6-dehydratase, partial [archaeon]
GSWLTQILIKCGAIVSGYALSPATNPSLFKVLGLQEKIGSHFGDIRDREKLANVLHSERPEFVFHLAAQPLVRDSYDNPLYTFETNVVGTANLLELIRESDVKSAVIVTTDKVYEDKGDHTYREHDKLGGHDPYGASKACAELVVQSYRRSFFDKGKTLVASARSGNVIGGGDWAKGRLIPDIIRETYEDGNEIVLRNPNAIRPWQHVLEPITGYLMLAVRLYNHKDKFADAWNFAPEERNFITVSLIAEKSLNIIKKGTFRVERDPRHETEILKLDSTKSRELLKWKSVLGVDEALQWTFDWYKSFYANKDIISLTDSQIETYYQLLDNGT